MKGKRLFCLWWSTISDQANGLMPSFKDANEMDGVVGLSQCAIGLSESFTYRFHIDDTQYGTFWFVAFSCF
jgi:FtsP/CotA-like multicopper oxidase with cupredoxin domain